MTFLDNPQQKWPYQYLKTTSLFSFNKYSFKIFITFKVNYRLPLSIADEDQSEILSRQIASLLMQPMTTKVVTRNRFYPTQLL
jgi:hypothetical protein